MVAQFALKVEWRQDCGTFSHAFIINFSCSTRVKTFDITRVHLSCYHLGIVSILLTSRNKARIVMTVAN